MPELDGMQNRLQLVDLCESRQHVLLAPKRILITYTEANGECNPDVRERFGSVGRSSYIRKNCAASTVNATSALEDEGHAHG
jgi:hypothetical protein